MAPCRRAVHVRSCLPVLQQIHREQGVRSERSASNTVGAAERRTRLFSDQSLGGLWSPLRGDRGPWTARRTDPGRAIRFSPRCSLDNHRRSPRRRGAGFRDPLLFNPSGREVARPDGEGGDWTGCRLHRARRGDGNNDRSDRGAGTGGRQRAQGQPVGCRHARADDSDGVDHGHLPALDPAPPRARSERNRYRALDAVALRRQMGGGESGVGADLHADRPHAGAADHGVQLLRLGAPRLASARAARLSLGVRENRRGVGVGARHHHRITAAADAGADTVHQWNGAGVRGENLPVRIYHHRLRVDQRLPRANRVGHDAETHRQ